MRVTPIILAATLGLAATPAAAKSTCTAMVAPLTGASRAADAALVSGTGQRTTAADVTYVLREPGWRLVWATPAQAERGVFFFRSAGRGYRLVDTWGGVLAPGEQSGAVKWARELKGDGPSLALATCFAKAVAAGK